MSTTLTGYTALSRSPVEVSIHDTRSVDAQQQIQKAKEQHL